MVDLEPDCRRHGHIRLLTADELPLPETTCRQREPFKWSVRLPNGQNVGVLPDRVFGLEYSGPECKLVRANYFLEADRCTMPLQRQNLSQSSIYRKLLAYEAT